MATIRKGHQAVLLVVDMQEGVMRTTWDSDRVVQNAARVVERAREKQIPVIWVQHSDDELIPGTADWQIVSDLVPAESDTHLQKAYNSCFEETSLDAILAEMGVTHIFLAGAATNWCIRATAYGALDRGYDLTLISDAHTTESIDLQDGGFVSAESIVKELNIAMTWLSYPGRKNGTISAAKVVFEPL